MKSAPEKIIELLQESGYDVEFKRNDGVFECSVWVDGDLVEMLLVDQTKGELDPLPTF